jgi:hypothetical protein
MPRIDTELVSKANEVIENIKKSIKAARDLQENRYRKTLFGNLNSFVPLKTSSRLFLFHNQCKLLFGLSQ